MAIAPSILGVRLWLPWIDIAGTALEQTKGATVIDETPFPAVAPIAQDRALQDGARLLPSCILIEIETRNCGQWNSLNLWGLAF